MTKMIALAPGQADIQNADQNEARNEAQTETQTGAQVAQEKSGTEERRRYSGNDVLHLTKVLDDAKMNMDRKFLSMNDVVHLALDRLDGMLKTRRCSCADLARLATNAGFPVAERTMKDYLARARKDAREGRTEYSGLKKLILDAAKSQENADSTAAEPFSARPVQAESCPAARRKYSGNDFLHLMKVLDEAKMDMDSKCLSMNDVVHLVLDRLDGMLKTRRCSLADLARLVTKAGFPVTERTLKDYLARSRKDAREGCTDYSELKKLILGSDSNQAGTDSRAAAEAFSAGDDASTDGQEASSEEFGTPDNDYLALSVSADSERIEKRDMARLHVQAFYAARKRRKKARKHK